MEPSSTQKFAKNKQAGSEAYIPTTPRIFRPMIYATIVLEGRPLSSAKAKRRCLQRYCSLNILINVNINIVIVSTSCIFNMAAQKIFLVTSSLIPVSLGQTCFVSVLSRPITSQDNVYPEMDFTRTGRLPLLYLIEGFLSQFVGTLCQSIVF